MYPKFNTSSGKEDLKQNLSGSKYYFQAFKTIPSIINENITEGLSNEELEAVAIQNSIDNDMYESADEFGSERKSLSEAGLDESITGKKLLKKNLGYLSDKDNMSISDFAESTQNESTQNNYMKLLKGNVSEVLSALHKEKPDEGNALEVNSFFVIKYDQETGEPILKEVIGTKKELAKLEAAGASVINEYGPKKYSENSLLAGTKAFVKGLHSMWPGLNQFAAGAGDLFEATANLVKGEGFKAEYSNINAKADYLTDQLETMPYSTTTSKADRGMFDNLNSFSNVMGQTAASLAQYAAGGQAVNAIMKASKGIALLGAGGIGKLGAAKAADKVSTVLTSAGVDNPTLGFIGKNLNSAFVKSPEILPMLSSGMVLNYGEAYQAARQAGLSLEDASIIGFSTGAINTIIEQKFGSNVLNSWLASGKGTKKAAEIIIKETGGDINKLYDREISNTVLSKVTSMVDAFSRSNKFGLGTAFEEGSEEILQGLSKNSVEIMYDIFVAPENIEVGKGKFGTSFNKESFKQLLEEGAAGAIMGAFGGFIASRQKENRSIIPFIASGDTESLLAGANIALEKGAISEEQYNGISNRIQVLDELHTKNNDLFAQTINYDPTKQVQIASTLLETLRNQQDFAEIDQSIVLEDPLSDLDSFTNLVNGAFNVTVDNKQLGINTLNAFAKQLKNSNRASEYKLLNNVLNDSKSKAKDLVPKVKIKTDLDKQVYNQALNDITNEIFNRQFNIAINGKKVDILTNKLNTVIADNFNLSNVDPNSNEYSDINKRISDNINNLSNNNLDESIVNQALQNLKKDISKKYTQLYNDNFIKTGIKDYIDNAMEIEFLNVSNTLNKSNLDNILNNKNYTDVSINNIREEESKKEESKLQEEIKIKISNDTKSDEYYDDLLKSEEYANGLDKDQEQDENTKNKIESAKNGNVDSQLDLIKNDISNTVSELNNTPVSESERRSQLKNILSEQTQLKNYLEQKKKAVDKEIADVTPVKVSDPTIDDKNIIHNGSNTDFTLDQNNINRSNKNGFALTLINNTNGESIEVSGDELSDYSTKDGKTLKDLTNDLEKQYKKSLSGIKLDADKKDSYEPLEDSKKENRVYESDETYSNTIRLAIKNTDIEKLINKPNINLSNIPVEIELSANIDNLTGYTYEKDAKSKFNNLLKLENPTEAFNKLDNLIREILIKNLPIQIRFNYSGVENITYAFPDASESKSLLVLALLKNNGKLSIPKGALQRTPGYINHSNTNDNLITALNLSEDKSGDLLFPDKTALRIGIADANGSVFYNDHNEDAEYLLTANMLGSKGTPYLIIPSSQNLTGKEGYGAKLNPTKIHKDIAERIVDIFTAIANKNVALNYVVRDGMFGVKVDEDSEITVGQLLNDLIFFGDTTLIENNKNKSVSNKQLIIDFSNTSIKYGEALDIFNPKDESSISNFKEWITKNKNYSIKRLAVNLNEVSPATYSITGNDGTTISFKKGEKYLTSIIKNGFIQTDLNINNGLIKNSYLLLNAPKPSKQKTVPVKNPITKPQEPTKATQIKETKSTKDTKSSKSFSYKEGVFEYSGILNSVKNLPNNSKILSRNAGSKEVSDNSSLYIINGFIYNKENEKVLDISEYDSDETFSKALRKELANSFNSEIRRIVKFEKEHPESMKVETMDGFTGTVSSAGLLIATSINKGDKVVQVPDYYKSIRTVFLKESEELKTKENPIEIAKVAEPEIVKPVENNISIEGYNANTNPFTNEIKTANANNVDKLKELYNNYDSLSNYLSQLTDKTAYMSALNSIFLDYSYPKSSGLNESQINELINYRLSNGTKIGSVLLTIGNNIKTVQNPIEPIIETQQKEEIETLKETVIIDDISPEAINAMAGVTFDSAERAKKVKNKSKGKFGGRASTPMEINVNEVLEGYSVMNAKKDLKIYRRLLSKQSGGDIKFTNKLIETIGTSGNPVLAYAIMHKAGIDLFDGAIDGAIYHEAFHRVSLLLIDPEQNKRLYGFARKTYSLYNRSEKEIEEFLADRFREYVIKNESNIKGSFIKNIFSDIRNFLKSLIGLKTNITSLNGLFKSISNGEYKYSKVNESALTNFEKVYGNTNPVPLTINNVTFNEIKNSNTYQKIVDTITATTLDYNGIESIQDLTKGIDYSLTLDELINTRDGYKESLKNDSASQAMKDVFNRNLNLYNEIISNFNTIFKPAIETKLKGYNIRRMSDIMSDRDSLNDIVNDEIHSSYEFSAKDNTQADIRVTFLTLKSSSKLDPITYMPQYVNPDVAWYNTFSLLHKAKSINEMIDKLQEQGVKTSTLLEKQGEADSINMYSELYERLANADEMYKTRFWNTFKKHRNRFVNVYFNNEINESNGKKLASYNMRFGDADLNKRSNRVEQIWSASFGVNGTFRDKNKIQKAIDDWKELVNNARNPRFIKDSNYQETLLEIQRILSSIDIVIDDKTIGIILGDYFFNSNLNTSLRNFLLDPPRANEKFGIVGLNYLFSEASILSDILNDNAKDIDELNLLSSEKSVKKLAEAYVKANPTSEDDSVIGPDGNLVYAYSENNTITSMFEDWIKDDSFLAQLNGVTYNRSSVWLSQLNNKKTRDNIHISTVLSMLDRDGYDRGRGYLDIAPVEDILMKFNAVLNNKTLLPTLANKRTYYFIEGFNKLKVSLTDTGLNKEVVNTFINYAENERVTIKEAKEARDAFLSQVGTDIKTWDSLSGKEQNDLLKSTNTNYKNLVENYHYQSKDDKIVFSNGNAYNFRYFKQLEGKDNLFDNKTELYKVIESILNQQINETIKYFINKRIIIGDSKYVDDQLIKEEDSNHINTKVIKGNNLLPISVVSAKGNVKLDIAQAIADYSINNAINILEFEKLVSGDLAYYKTGGFVKSLDDRVKRYSALTSTKSQLRQDFPEEFLDFDQSKYNVIILKSNILESKDMYNYMYNKYVGTNNEKGMLLKQYEKFRERRLNGFDNLSDEELKEKTIKDTKFRLNGYLLVDQTDAQVLITPDFFRKLSIMNGEWNDQKEDAFNLMESDEELSLEDELIAYNTLMQPLKYIHFGYDFFNGLQVPIYDKMSLATIFKRIAKDRDLEYLYNAMKTQNIDMAKFDTAGKSGNRQKTELYTSEGDINKEIFNAPIFKQDYKYLGKQLVTDPHHVSRIPLGTQFVKIAVAGIENDAIYTDVNGNGISGDMLIKEYVDTISKLSDIGKEDLFKDFGIKEISEIVNGETKTYLSIDKDKFVTMLKEDAISSNTPANLIDALKTVESDNGNNDYYVELSTLPSLNWIHSRIISMIKKATIDINTPGNAFIQMSNFGFKSIELEGKFKDNSFESKGYHLDKNLKFRNKDNRLEAIVSINLFKDVLPKYLNSFEEKKAYLLANPNLAVLGYRIPTQGMNSTLAITIVDVLPETVGDTIILPAELTTLTGADFDIDKMYIARYNYEDINGKLEKIEFVDDYIGIDENGNEIYLNEYDYLKKVYDYKYKHYFGDFYKNALRDIPKILQYVNANVNKNNGTMSDEDLNIIDSMISKYSIFLNKKNVNKILSNKRITDSNKLLDISEQFRYSSELPTFEEFLSKHEGKSKWDLNNSLQIENKLLDIFNTTLVSMNHYVDSTTPLDFATGAIKDVVNIVDSFSNINKSYRDLEPLFPRYQENVKEQNMGADAGIGPMALINTFRTMMQIAKLDINRNVALNSNGRNLVNFLGIKNLYEKFDRAGVPILDWTSALINAHVDAAKDSYITRLNVNQYTYDVVALLISGGVGRDTFFFLPQPILKQISDEAIRVQSSKIGISKKEKARKVWMKKITDPYITKVGKTVWFKFLESGEIEQYADKIFNEQWLTEQLSVKPENRTKEWYKNQLIIFEYFKDVQKYSKALSNLILASQVDTGKFGKNANELRLFKHAIEAVLTSPYFTNIKDVFNKTFLGKKTENSVDVLYNLLKTEIIEFSPAFGKTIDAFGMLSNTYYDRKTNNINAYSSDIKFAIQSEFFNVYTDKNNINRKDLFYGDNTVVDKINIIRTAALTGSDYYDLKDNALLKLLLPGLNKSGEPKKFELSTTKQRDTDSKNEYTYAWRDLLEHSDETVRNAANDLILYAFYTSGGKASGIYSMLDLVPYEVLGNMSYSKDDGDYTYNRFMKEVLIDANDNNSIFNETKYIDYAFRASKTNDDIVPIIEENKNTIKNNSGIIEYITLNADDALLYNTQYGTFSPYVKMERPVSKDEITYDLYKLFGYKVQSTSSGEVNNLPIYKLVNSINFKDRGFTINEGTIDTFIDKNKSNTVLDENEVISNFIKSGNFFKLSDSAIFDKDYLMDSSDSQTVFNEEDVNIENSVQALIDTVTQYSMSNKDATIEIIIEFFETLNSVKLPKSTISNLQEAANMLGENKTALLSLNELITNSKNIEELDNNIKKFICNGASF